LAEFYDAIKKAGSADNPMSVAWAQWKKLYKKQDGRWTAIKAASIQFGTEQFVASQVTNTGIPSHAIQIEGKLIHIGTKNLAGWGITEAATEQIMAGIPGVPIRACSAQDPHACDYAFDNKSHIGYGVRSWIEDGWIHAAAAITGKDAVKHISDGTWLPWGKGGWSVAGLPTDKGADFETDGLMAGYQPTGISLVFAPAIPAFVGSGFDMVAAAVNYDHGDDNMEVNEGGGTPATYTQDELDVKLKEALDAQKTEFDTDAKKGHDAELVKQKTEAAETLAKQKTEHDAAIEKLSADDRAAFDARIAEMTPTPDVEKMIAAAVAQGQADTLAAIEKDRLANEYGEMLTASVVLGAPIRTDGVIDPAKLAAKMEDIRGMQVAAISSLITDAKMMVAAAAPAQSAFDQTVVPGQAPGSSGGDAELLADLTEMDSSVGRVVS
jgi:hypothetical protein